MLSVPLILGESVGILHFLNPIWVCLMGMFGLLKKIAVHKIVLESHSEVFHAFCMQVNKCDVIYTVLLNKDYVGE